MNRLKGTEMDRSGPKWTEMEQMDCSGPKWTEVDHMNQYATAQ